MEIQPVNSMQYYPPRLPRDPIVDITVCNNIDNSIQDLCHPIE